MNSLKKNVYLVIQYDLKNQKIFLNKISRLKLSIGKL